MQSFMVSVIHGNLVSLAVLAITIIVVAIVISWIAQSVKYCRLASKHFGDAIPDRIETKKAERQRIKDSIAELEAQLAQAHGCLSETNDAITELKWLKHHSPRARAAQAQG